VLRRREREAQWRKRVGAWRQSGLSQSAFCRREALAPADFSWWKHELARRDGLSSADRAASSSLVGPQFVPLQVTAVQARGACALELRNGRRLQIEDGADATDMRRSFDKLAEMTRSVLAQDPLSGHLFVFFNRPRDRVKILFWDRSGFCLYYKRLEEGSFRPPQNSSGQIGAAELTLILEGIALAGAKRQPRYSPRKM